MKKEFLVSLFLFLIFFSGFVSAFAMSPGSHRFEYDEINGLQEDFSFILRSSSSSTIAISVGTSHDLAEYITVNTDDIILKPGEAKKVDISLNIPPNLDEVDVKEARIIFTKKIQDSQGFMAVTTALVARILVTFAYPGEYIIITKLAPVNVNQGEDTVVNWEVQARGTRTTGFVSTLFVTSASGEEVFSRTFDRRFLERNERYSDSTFIPSSSFLSGNFNVSLKAVSFDNEVESSRILRVGEEDISLKSFSPSNFSVGEIVMFSFVVESLWNGVFSNVYGILDIGNASTTTKSVKLDAFGEVNVDKQYIDLRDLDEGIHKGSLTVFFDGKSKVFDVELVALSSSRSVSGVVIWLSVSILILLIIGFLLVFLFRKTNRRVL
ncbi:hypothetical protein KO361_02660 [Candidatus Woesearchaeota archaeon]|nr:hypothetical protein [Candidatus Woesearchaeota archaeon]